MTRNDIMQALLAQVTPPGVFQTTGRRLIYWTDCDAQPALFVRHMKDHYDRGPTRLPARVTVECEVWIYARTGEDPQVTPDVALNDLVDLVEQQLRPAANREAQTLGGLVTHAWIAGTIEYEPGDIFAQGIAILPVMILVPTINGG
jgi:hypothetical protein